MKHNGNLTITKENQNDFKNLTEVSGSIYVYEGATLTAPALTKSGYIYVRQGATLTAPALTKSGYIDVRQGATLTAPALTKSGYIYVYEGAKINIPQTKGLNYKSVDNTLFVIEAEKTSKGIKIYTGYVMVKILDGKAIKNNCFVSEKDGFMAHGETVKKSIQDLQFKIMAEKLKNEPIHADTIITVNHYRLITGACELGVKLWMEQNNITSDEIKASDLLPILKKTNAYGLDKFEALKSF